jgi:hypothetical protein
VSEDIGEVEVHPRIHFLYSMPASIEFSFVLGLSDTGLAYLTCMYGLVLPLSKNQPLFCTGA